MKSLLGRPYLKNAVESELNLHKGGVSVHVHGRKADKAALSIDEMLVNLEDKNAALKISSDSEESEDDWSGSDESNITIEEHLLL